MASMETVPSSKPKIALPQEFTPESLDLWVAEMELHNWIT
jgi:hypothetical protein